MNSQSKKSLIIGFSFLLLFMAMQVFAVLPPKYLAIKGFKQCLDTKDMGTWKALCMPAQKPDACSDEAWQQLKKLTGKDKLPDC